MISGNGNIKEVCNQIVAEAQAIIAYTNSIETVFGNDLISVFAETRNDELSHLQKLVVALTELMSGEEPTEAEGMDGNDGGEDE